MRPTPKADLFPALRRAVDRFGRAAVDAAALQTLMYPASWVTSVSEARRIERALANSLTQVPHG